MVRFPYLSHVDVPGSLMPRLPVTLTLNDVSVEVIGLVDSGATVNVLPYEVGLALGAVWEAQTNHISLAGNLAQAEARVLLVEVSQPQITGQNQVLLVFAWTRARNVPVIFGQMSFFLEFNVCFYRSQGFFDVQLNHTD